MAFELCISKSWIYTFLFTVYSVSFNKAYKFDLIRERLTLEVGPLLFHAVHIHRVTRQLLAWISCVLENEVYRSEFYVFGRN